MRSSGSGERKVLLVDSDPLKCGLRAMVFRNCEIDVHTARSVADAFRLCQTQAYDLVLLTKEHVDEVLLTCQELRRITPRQRLAILIGPPLYVREVGRARKRPRQPASSLPQNHETLEPASPLTQWSRMLQELLAAS
jgi:hypothetical protein